MQKNVVKQQLTSNTVNHILRTEDGGHQPNKLHKFIDRCSTCGYSNTYTRACNGPPCPLPYSMPNDPFDIVEPD